MHRLIRPLAAVALVLVAGFTIAACGGGATEPPATGVTLEATEFAFAPDSLTAKAGETLKVTLTNKGTVEHDFTIDSLSVKAVALVGTSADVTLKNLAAGTYPFYCSVAGHREAGMEGTLVVE